MKRVDVAVPCYRYGHFLRECVQSVLTQYDVEVRVLILDDASPDDTPSVAAELMAADSRVSYRRHPVNHGSVATFNEGIDWASADYTMILSADDLLTPGALSRATNLMEAHRDVGLSLGGAIVTTDPSSQKSPPPSQYNCQLVAPAQWVESFCAVGGNIAGSQTCTAVVRTSVWKKCGGFRPELPHAGDMEIWLRLGMQGPVGLVCAKQGYYRQHGAAMHHLYSGILDLRQVKAAFDFFFQEHGHRLAECQRLRQLADRRLSQKAVKKAQEAFSRSESAAGRELLEFARELEPRVFAEQANVWRELARACAELTSPAGTSESGQW